MQAVAGEADSQGPPDEPVGEGVLGKVREEPARHHPARSAGTSFPAGVPRERRRAEQPAGLEGVAPGDGEGEPGLDALRAGQACSSFSPVTGTRAGRNPPGGRCRLRRRATPPASVPLTPARPVPFRRLRYFPSVFFTGRGRPPETHEGQIEETMDALTDGPERCYKSYPDR